MSNPNHYPKGSPKGGEFAPSTEMLELAGRQRAGGISPSEARSEWHRLLLAHLRLHAQGWSTQDHARAAKLHEAQKSDHERQATGMRAARNTHRLSPEDRRQWFEEIARHDASALAHQYLWAAHGIESRGLGQFQKNVANHVARSTSRPTTNTSTARRSSLLDPGR